MVTFLSHGPRWSWLEVLWFIDSCQFAPLMGCNHGFQVFFICVSSLPPPSLHISSHILQESSVTCGTAVFNLVLLIEAVILVYLRGHSRWPQNDALQMNVYPDASNVEVTLKLESSIYWSVQSSRYDSKLGPYKKELLPHLYWLNKFLTSASYLMKRSSFTMFNNGQL